MPFFLIPPLHLVHHLPPIYRIPVGRERGVKPPIVLVVHIGEFVD